MAGIYIHVPYCTQRCVYCDFYTQTNLKSRSDYVLSLCKEIELRKGYVGEEKIETIYFGGGTPSLLTEDDFQKVFKKIFEVFDVEKDAEITLEANPDDLSKDYLSSLQSLPFNRMSIGIQSFDEKELKFLNRRHTAEEAINAVSLAKNAGFQNISIDLMYGLPYQTMDVWKTNLEKAIELDIQHISAYHLIYEQGTKLFKMFEKGQVKQAEEDLSLSMFSAMIDKLTTAGFDHYEISNFAKPERISRHNSSYWLGKTYLGLGPAAHSFNGVNRVFNVASITKYIRGIDSYILPTEEEILSSNARYNEFVLTGLRTKWGVDLEKLKNVFDKGYLEYCLLNANKYIESGDLVNEDKTLKLSRKGIFISDAIMSDLMWI